MSFRIPLRRFVTARHCRPLIVVLAASALSACVSSPGPTIAGSGRCDDSQLQWAVGQLGDETNMRRLARESGAGLVNPVGPGTVLSRDHRDDRLRVHLDGDNRITAARCE